MVIGRLDSAIRWEPVEIGASEASDCLHTSSEVVGSSGAESNFTGAPDPFRVRVRVCCKTLPGLHQVSAPGLVVVQVLLELVVYRSGIVLARKEKKKKNKSGRS